MMIAIISPEGRCNRAVSVLHTDGNGMATGYDVPFVVGPHDTVRLQISDNDMVLIADMPN